MSQDISNRNGGGGRGVCAGFFLLKPGPLSPPTGPGRAGNRREPGSTQGKASLPRALQNFLALL